MKMLISELESDTRFTDEPLTTGIVSTTFSNSLIFIENKNNDDPCHVREFPTMIAPLSRHIDTNHTEVTKLRIKDFFNELKDLLKIDNAYRGIYRMDSCSVITHDEFETDHISMVNEIQTFFYKLTELIKEDNQYRGAFQEVIC